MCLNKWQNHVTIPSSHIVPTDTHSYLLNSKNGPVRNLHIKLTIIYTFITYILNFFLPEQNAPDYATIGHTRVSVRRMLSVCGGYSSGKHKADKRLLYCKQSADLRRLSFSPFQTGLFCIGLKLRPLRYRSPGGRFNSITVCCTLRWVVTLNVLSVEKGP